MMTHYLDVRTGAALCRQLLWELHATRRDGSVTCPKCTEEMRRPPGVLPSSASQKASVVVE